MNSVCRSFGLDIYGGVTAALKRPFTLQTGVEERSVQVVIEITTLGRRKDSWRLVSRVRKGGLVPIRECEWDKPGGFTRSGLDDSRRRLPRSLCLSASCDHILGSAVPFEGKRNGRELPPFFLPGSGTVAWRESHWRQRPLGGVAPVPSIPGGKATNDTRDGQDGTHERPRHPRRTDGDPQKEGG